MEASGYLLSLTKTIQDNEEVYTRLKQILDLKSDENDGIELRDINEIRLKNIMFYDDLSLAQIDFCKTRKMCFEVCEKEPVLLVDTLKYNISMNSGESIDLKRLSY